MLLIIICLFSLALGSFANNVISHLAEGTEFDVFRSRCLCGDKYLESKEIIPLLSFALQKGKCSRCRKSIPFRYPVVEILVLTLGVLAYNKFGFSVLLGIRFLIYYVLFMIGVIDFLAFRIPNKLVLTLVILYISELIFSGEAVPFTGILPGILVSGMLFIINYFSIKLRNTALIGMGDLKLIALLFVLFKFPGSLFSLWMASFLGLSGYYFIKYMRNKKKIPFGAFLSLSFILCDLSGGIPGKLYHSYFELMR